MIVAQIFLVLSLVIGASIGLPVDASHRGTRALLVPSKNRQTAVYDQDYDAKVVAKRIESWKPEDKENAWELSGLFEGDIMIYTNDDVAKNGILNETTRWPGGIVPLYIEKKDFDNKEIGRIKAAVEEYHRRTCLRFRPYIETDDDYVIIQGSEPGCWSSVGRRGEGQVLNLQNEGCMKHGTIVHELMHALGFYHQQSASNRDEFVKIHFENVREGKEGNFNKYDTDEITDYGVSYDYESVMHYSGFAFSKNGKRTITPMQEGVEIGQRKGLSEKDVTKLQAMYKEECGDRKPEENNECSDDSSLDNSLGWLVN